MWRCYAGQPACQGTLPATCAVGGGSNMGRLVRDAGCASQKSVRLPNGRLRKGAQNIERLLRARQKKTRSAKSQQSEQQVARQKNFVVDAPRQTARHRVPSEKCIQGGNSSSAHAGVQNTAAQHARSASIAHVSPTGRPAPKRVCRGTPVVLAVAVGSAAGNLQRVFAAPRTGSDRKRRLGLWANWSASPTNNSWAIQKQPKCVV